MMKNDVVSNCDLYLSELVDEINKAPMKDIEKACEVIFDAFKCGKTLYIAGNGGSAASANHFYADLSNELLIHNINSNARVNSLCDSIVRLTAIANDYGYENVFSQQLSHGQEGDILLLLSVSGESKNLIKAADLAQSRSMKIVSVTSMTSTLTHISHISIIFGDCDYGLSEDFQSIFLHMLKRMINNNIPHKC
jgi:D-sedoheptulose 7-phosphate isomerase